MDWKEMYARRFIEDPIQSIDLEEFISRTINTINIRLKEEHVKQEVVLELENNKIIFPDCVVSYVFEGEQIKFTKTVNGNIFCTNVFIKWVNGFYKLAGSITNDIDVKMYSSEKELIDDVFHMLLR